MRLPAFLSVSIFILLSACTKTDTGPAPVPGFIRAADLSLVPVLESRLLAFRDVDGSVASIPAILKRHGVNTIRLRLWVDPTDGHSGLAEVTAFADRLHDEGLDVWISVHYSDTWADPGQQAVPSAWSSLDFHGLADSVSAYTRRVVEAIRPEVIQIGNEINDGFLWPQGRLSEHPDQCTALLDTAIHAIRSASPDTRIMVHVAGFQSTEWVLDHCTTLDYDLIGLSWYPWWHGKDMSVLETRLADLHQVYGKEVVVAETAYPFTLGWNDWTDNIVGTQDQLILPDYPATADGQSHFLGDLRDAVIRSGGRGFCWWGGEWVAFNGPQSTNGSTWENLALFDFQLKALPVVSAFD